MRSADQMLARALDSDSPCYKEEKPKKKLRSNRKQYKGKIKANQHPTEGKMGLGPDLDRSKHLKPTAAIVLCELKSTKNKRSTNNTRSTILTRIATSSPFDIVPHG